MTYDKGSDSDRVGHQQNKSFNRISNIKIITNLIFNVFFSVNVFIVMPKLLNLKPLTLNNSTKCSNTLKSRTQ